MGAIYLYDWYSRCAPSHLYEGIICGIEKSIISISIGIWREAQFRRHSRRSGAILAVQAPFSPFRRHFGASGAKGEGGGAGLWRLLLTLQQQPPQTGAPPTPLAPLAPERREKWRLNGGSGA